MCKDKVEFNPDSYVHVLANEVKRRFAFNAGTLEELKHWQSDFRPHLREVLGFNNIESRGRCSLEPKQIDEEIFDTHVRQEWNITTEPGFELPFFVLLPNEVSKPYPLVLTPHGHNKSGKNLYVGICENKKEMIEGQRDIALQAVQAGYVAIAPDMRGLGTLRRKQELETDIPKSCPAMQMHALMFGRNLIGERVWDIMRLIDYAKTRPEIDTSRVAITGNSGGGTVSLYAAACDERINVCIPSSCFATFEDSIGSIRHCECNYVPQIMTLGEIYDIAGLIAPRRFLAIAGREDDIFPVESVKTAYKKLKQVYEAAGCPDNCRLCIGDGGHRYFKKPVWKFVEESFAYISRGA